MLHRAITAPNSGRVVPLKSDGEEEETEMITYDVSSSFDADLNFHVPTSTPTPPQERP